MRIKLFLHFKTGIMVGSLAIIGVLLLQPSMLVAGLGTHSPSLNPESSVLAASESSSIKPAITSIGIARPFSFLGPMVSSLPTIWRPGSYSAPTSLQQLPRGWIGGTTICQSAPLLPL